MTDQAKELARSLGTMFKAAKDAKTEEPMYTAMCRVQCAASDAVTSNTKERDAFLAIIAETESTGYHG